MSNYLVIPAVTSVLRKTIMDVMEPIVPGIDVTTLPLDKARDANANTSQINICLYHTTVNTGWRNLSLPSTKQGETSYPPLALNLYYLVTAYGQDNSEVIADGLLAGAMSVLHDTPVLNPADLRTILPPPNTPGDQMERIRVTYEPLSVEEISKLWTAFQVGYRLSAAYQVTVVLIDSTRPLKAALPVLRRGQDDQGVTSLTAFPQIDSVKVLEQTLGAQPAALPGNTLIISGTGLQASNLVVRIANPRLPASLEITPLPGGSASEIRIQLPSNAPADWPPGFYTVGVIIKQPLSSNVLFASNELPFSLLPTITSFSPNPALRVVGDVTLNVVFTPQVWPEQRVALLVGDREVQKPDHAAKVNTLTFTVIQAAAGQFYLRLRVDGVDSSLIDPASALPQYDNSKRVTII